MDKVYRIVVVIVNYKTSELTCNCVKSLKTELSSELDHIVVIDNNSGSEDIKALKKAFKKIDSESLVSLVELNENNGFSAGNNAGIKSLKAQYYLLTNSDTEILPGAVSKLLEAAKNNQVAGIISPRLEGIDGIAQVSCFRFHSPLSEIIRSSKTGIVTRLFQRFSVPLQPVEEITRPDWTSFACVLIREEVIQNVGLLDDGYFMYFEDTDYCRRARKQGYEIMNWPSAKVVHLQGKSSNNNKLAINRESFPDYFYLSRYRYYIKFYGRSGFFFSNLCWLAGRFVSFLREIITGKERLVPKREFFSIWKTK